MLRYLYIYMPFDYNFGSVHLPKIPFLFTAKIDLIIICMCVLVVFLAILHIDPLM